MYGIPTISGNSSVEEGPVAQKCIPQKFAVTPSSVEYRYRNRVRYDTDKEKNRT